MPEKGAYAIQTHPSKTAGDSRNHDRAATKPTIFRRDAFLSNLANKRVGDPPISICVD